MATNSEFEKTYDEITKYLKIFYLWPKTDQEDEINLYFYFKALVSFITFTLPFYGAFAHLIHFLHHGSSALMFDLSLVLVYVCHTIILIMYMSNLKVVVKNFRNYVRRTTDSNKLNYLLILRLIKLGLLMVVIVSVGIKKWDLENCQKRSSQGVSIGESCGFVLPIYLPFDYETFPQQQILLFIQCTSLFFAFLLFINLVIFTLYCLEQLIIEIVNLRHAIKTKFPTEETEVYSFLTRCIARQGAALQRFTVINMDLKYMMLVHYYFAGLLLAFFAIYIIEDPNFQSITNFLGWIISLSALESICQISINEGNKLRNTIYNIKWYNLSERNKKLVLAMLVASEKPLALQAGDMILLSLFSLLEIYKGAYSYFAILLKISK